MKRILVIEDDASVRGVIIDALRFGGWEPMDAPDGEAGAKLASSELPDLILCDIQMPKLDGYGVLQRVRGNPATATVPFIFLTGLGDKPKMRQAMELGADDYIVKPFTVKELIAAVEARFQKQAALEESTDKKLSSLRESISFALPHELVTPLNSILGFSSLLIESPGIGAAELHEYATHIRQSGERLRGVVEKFLLYAQVELAVADPEQRRQHANLPPNPTADTISVSARRAAGESARSGEISVAAAPVQHRISSAHLERIVRELVENAARFSGPGTPIFVRSELVDDVFTVEVADRGCGFSPEQIQQIGANQQFDRKLREQQGTGLGLAISKRLAELYGGTLQIRSNPGSETTVQVRLPA